MRIIKRHNVPLIRFTCECCKSIFEMNVTEEKIIWHSIDGSYTATCPVCNQTCRDYKDVTPEEFDESLDNL